MISWFRRKPIDRNLALQDLSIMLFKDEEDPTYKMEFFNPEKLDFSIESLKHIDEYLEIIHKAPPDDREILKIGLRVGAYVGEVIRNHAKKNCTWLSFDESQKVNKNIKKLGMQLGTAAVLWTMPDNIAFPISKVLKYIENGHEDNVYFYAKVAIESFS